MSEHPRRRLAGWILLALAGLVIAVALSVTAGNLSTQPIGISSEPLRAGDRLAPASVQTTATPLPRPKKHQPAKPTRTTTTTATVTTPQSGGSDSREGSDERNELHHDADDD